MHEVWKPTSVPGLFASSHGRVRVEPYEVPMPNGGVRVCEIKPTCGVDAKGDGRMLLIFRRKSYKVHQLVAEAFHGPKQPGQVCMHLDENYRNNRPENLRWGTQRENLNAPGFIQYCKGRTGANNPYLKGRRK